MDKSEKFQKEKLVALEKQEVNYKLRKATLAFNVKQLEEDEEKYLAKQKLQSEKQLLSPTLETAQTHNSANDTLNEPSLDDLTELLSSASLSDNINEKESDPSNIIKQLSRQINAN